MTSSRITNQWQTESGQSTHHILNVATGAPAQTAVLAATVITPRAALGEVFAKIPFMMPVAEALQYIEHRGAQACIIDSDLVMHTSQNWMEFVRE